MSNQPKRFSLRGIVWGSVLIFISLVFFSCVIGSEHSPTKGKISPTVLGRISVTPIPTTTIGSTNSRTGNSNLPLTISSPASSTPISTITPTISATPYVKTPTLASQSMVKVFQVVESSRCDFVFNYVLGAFWSQDGESFSYAVSSCDGMEWFSYDLKSHMAAPAEPLPNYDHSIWQRLDATPAAYKQEIYGHVSPSGKYVVYSVKNGESLEWWIAEVAGQYRLKIDDALEDAYHQIGKVVWLDQETRIVYSVNFEAGARVFVADLATGEMAMLYDGIYEWAVSPDGTKIMAMDETILVSSLDGEELIDTGEFGAYPQWSQNSKVIYYLSDFDSDWNLKAYHVVSGEVKTLLTATELEGWFGYTPGYSEFAVSPDEKEVIVWSESLFMVELSR